MNENLGLEVEKIRKLYFDEKKSTIQIAKIIGCSFNTVGNKLKNNGFKLRPSGSIRDVDIGIVWRLYFDENKTLQQVAEFMGCSKSHIDRTLKRNGFKLRTSNETRKLKLNLDEIKRLYLDEKKSPNQIAKIIGCSRSCMYKIFKNNGLKTRTTRESHLEFLKTNEGIALKRKLIALHKDKPLSHITRKKLSDIAYERKARLGYINSPEKRKKISKSLLEFYKTNKGKEIIKKTGEARKGNIPWNLNLTKETDERVRTVSEKMMGEKNPMHGKTGKNHPGFGIPLSKETRDKIGKANEGHIVLEETRNKHRTAINKFYESPEGQKLRQKWSTEQSGEGNKNWQGGKSFEPYDPLFNKKFRNDIRKRDNNICMMCGKHREQLDEALNVHHMDYDKLNTTPANCISLCKSCHMKTNFRREENKKFLQSIMTKVYGYEYTADGKIVIDLNKIQRERNE